jgi:hypothetical protein
MPRSKVLITKGTNRRQLLRLFEGFFRWHKRKKVNCENIDALLMNVIMHNSHDA